MSNEEQPVVLVVEDNPTGIASLVGILGAACELVVAKTLAEAERCLSECWKCPRGAKDVE